MRHRHGFTVLDLLLAVALTALLAGLATDAAVRLRGRLGLDVTVQRFVQDVRTAHASARTRGVETRVRVLAPDRYVVEEAGPGGWQLRHDRRLPGDHRFANLAVGDELRFGGHGFGAFALAAGAAEGIRIEGAGRRVDVVPTLSGAVRTVPR